MTGIMGITYYLVQYADGMTSLTHTLRGYMMEAIRNGTAVIVAEEASIADMDMEIFRLGL